MKKHRMDYVSIWRALKGLGSQHEKLAEFLVEELLRLGVHFDVTEPNVDDPVPYLCKPTDIS